MGLLDIFADFFDRRIVDRAERQRANAESAIRQWPDTRKVIASEVEQFKLRGHGRWELIGELRHSPSIQVELHTDEPLPEAIGSPELKEEDPAYLVYSLHPNGSVVVIAYPPSSAHARPDARADPTGTPRADEGSPHYIIDYFPRACQLAGLAGPARVRKHLRKLGKLSVLTRARAVPTPTSERFLRGLSRRAERFAFVHHSAQDARVHRLSQELALGIGLIAGLIASTIFPLARDYGKEAATRAAATQQACASAHGGSMPKYDACLAAGQCGINHWWATALSTGNILAFAIMLTTFALWVVWRNSIRR